MKNSMGRLAAALTGAALTIGALGVTAPASALPATPERLAGATRYSTSAEVGRALYPAPDVVHIASGKTFPDALTGAVVAARNDAPLYLVGDALDDTVRARLSAGMDAVILGGTGSVSEKVAEEIDAIVDRVDRLAGSSRYATAAAISKATFPTARTVYIASGEVFADALSGAPAAARSDAPMLLVKNGAVPAEVKAELDRLRPENIVVLGGSGSVSDAVATELGHWGLVSRLAGGDRYATSAAIAGATHPGGARTVLVAAGQAFPDALSAAAPAGLLDAPLLLVSETRVAPTVLERHQALDPDRIIIVGGTGSVSDAVASTLGGGSGSGGSGGSGNPSDSAAKALAQLDAITVATSSASGYDRKRFGDWVNSGGCNTRHRVLARDLTNVTYSSGCRVASGTLKDPYSGATVELKSYSGGSSIEIDHIVPVSVAWYYGANTWSDEKRNQFYNDMTNLVAASSQENQAKGNKTLSQWVPPTDFACAYTERYVGTHATWDLAMPQADITKAREVLGAC